MTGGFLSRRRAHSMNDEATVAVSGSAASAWVVGASPASAFQHGLSVAIYIPDLVLFSKSIGFGALARDLGFTLGHAIFLSAAVYATPAQIVFIDQLSRRAALTAAAFAVTLTAVRLLPMAKVRHLTWSFWWPEFLRKSRGGGWGSRWAATSMPMASCSGGCGPSPPLWWPRS
jgi:hypothetical protein